VSGSNTRVFGYGRKKRIKSTIPCCARLCPHENAHGLIVVGQAPKKLENVSQSSRIILADGSGNVSGNIGETVERRIRPDTKFQDTSGCSNHATEHRHGGLSVTGLIRRDGGLCGGGKGSEVCLCQTR
jgi:hypothetical protein